MPDTKLRLEIAHVLFIDVVAYSRMAIDEQRRAIERLNDIVQGTEEFRKAEAVQRLVKIPTGDGMALVFYDSPEAPVECAMEISRKVSGPNGLQLRMGVHSGPVSGVVDVNGRANVAGEGINTAQRVMDCGDAGHILLSRRVAQDLSQFKHWRLHLHDLGECEVKHGVRLGVVNLFTSELGNSDRPTKLESTSPVIATGPASTVTGTPKAKRWSWFVVGVAAFVVILSGILFWRIQSKPGGTAQGAGEKSIAVLPFENLSENKENAFFADGVQDEVLTNLAKIADLKVISRTSVLQYKSGVPRNLREIGRQLGVAHLLEGSVQRAGAKVRVNAQLIDARTDAHLWGQTYDGDLADVFAIQSEIAQKIADQLRAKISASEKSSIAEKPTSDLQAYDLYAKARAIFIWNNPEDAGKSVQQQIDLLKQAIQRDPNFILAYCALAKAYADFSRDPTKLQSAEEAAKSALRLRSDSGEAHLALAYVYYAKNDFNRAISELEVAQRTLPNNSIALWIGGQIDRDQGRMEESLAKLQRAYELDPRNGEIAFHLQVTYRLMRRYREGEALLAKDVITSPMSAGWHYMLLAEFKFAEGDLTEGERLLAQVPQDFNPTAEIFLVRVSSALWRRDYDAASRLISATPLDRVEAIFGAQGWIEGFIARARGNKEEARSFFQASRQRTETLQINKPKDARFFAQLALCDAGLDRKDDALREAQHAADLGSNSQNFLEQTRVRRHLIMVYAWTGERDRAIKELEALVKLPGSTSYGQLRFDPTWDDLRGDPRFEKIVDSLAPK
jgi:TolB-like protein